MATSRAETWVKEGSVFRRRGLSDWGVAGTRNAFNHPFDEMSPWNVPLSTSATYEAATDTKTAAFLAGPAGQVNRGTYSIPVYLATMSDPLATITNTANGTTYSYRIPTTAVAASGLDGHCTIVQPDGVTIVEIFKFVRVSNTQVETSHPVETTLITGKGVDKGTLASNTSSIAGLIRTWEVAAVLAGTLAYFQHAVQMMTDETVLGPPGPNGTAGSFIYPANARDSFTYSGVVPMGTRLAIAPSVDLTTLGLTTLGLAFGKTLQNYGCFIIDRSQYTATRVEPGASGLTETDMKTDYQTKLKPLLRVVTGTTASSPGAGPAPYRVALAAPLAV